jgi:hypothetical protein
MKFSKFVQFRFYHFNVRSKCPLPARFQTVACHYREESEKSKLICNLSIPLPSSLTIDDAKSLRQTQIALLYKEVDDTKAKKKARSQLAALHYDNY